MPDHSVVAIDDHMLLGTCPSDTRIQVTSPKHLFIGNLEPQGPKVTSG